MASFSTTTLDSNGVPRLIDDEVRSVQFYATDTSTFANPDATFTGYASNGFFYVDGMPDPTHEPFKAGWASEGEDEGDENRGPVDAFPDRIFVVTTLSEVVILNADTLDVWMRFVLGGSSTFGTCLGLSGAKVCSSAFNNGVLVIATDAGARLVDFRSDLCLVLGAETSSRSDTGSAGIASRNEDGVLDFSELAGAVYLLSDEVLHVSIGTGALDITDPVTFGPIVALGQDKGLSVLQVPALATPSVKQHPFVLTGGSWRAVDDSDEDGTTPYIYDDTGDAQLAWSNRGVRIGDVLVLEDVKYTILGIDPVDDVLEVTPEIGSAAVGFSYEIWRPVPVVRVEAGNPTKLYIANGQQKVLLADSDTWYATGGAEIDGWTPSSECVSLSEEVSTLYDLVVSIGGDVYLATDLGVFKATVDNFDQEGEPSAEYLYSAGGTALTATYEILEGFSDCRALALDPETGHLAVCSTDGATSVLTEIDLSIHQAFRSEEYEAVVSALCGYRNTSGPPDEEVT